MSSATRAGRWALTPAPIPDLRTLDDASLAEELKGSRSDCEDHLGRPCRAIAYPYGDATVRIAHAARDAGYETGAIISQLMAHPGTEPDPMCWPRLGVLRRDGPLRLRLKVRLHRHPRAWNLVQRARGVER